MYIGKMVKNELKSEKGCSGSPFSYVLRFHNLFLYISNFIDIFIVVQKIISWKAGETELICLHGGLRLGRLPSLGKVGIEKIVFVTIQPSF